jgi:hypothetical protein
MATSLRWAPFDFHVRKSLGWQIKNPEHSVGVFLLGVLIF